MPELMNIKFTFFIIFLFTSISSFAQNGTISGRVLDKETQSPLPFCNVFINNSTISTTTDMEGRYVLREVPVGDYELGFSFIGYEYALKAISMKPGSSLTFDVSLVPVIQELSDVEIKSSRDKIWERDLKRFKTYFLGADENASQTEILNPWVLEFSKGKGNELSATAVQPLSIQNDALGYLLVFDLKEFIYTPDYYRIIGVSRFSELETTDQKLKAKWVKNRLDTYLKSPANMFRAMLDNRHEDEGFILYGDKPGGAETRNLRTDNFANELGRSVIAYKPANLVTPSKKPEEYRIFLKGRIEVHYQKAYAQVKTYKDAPYPISWIEVNGNYVVVNRFGMIQNPKDVVFSGDMDNKKMASLLPLDYEPMLTNQVESIAKNAASLQEKVYLHTDRHFYYAGDQVFFKAYMNYANPQFKSELSKVLHVELLDENREIKIRKKLFIENGNVVGDIYLPDSLNQRTYYLRAYTQWNKNYGPDTYFIKPLAVLLPSDRIVGKMESPQLQYGAKTTLSYMPQDFKVGEKVSVSVNVLDQNGKPINALLSVSVTDANYGGYLKEAVTIDQSYPLIAVSNQVNTDKFTYPIEKSLSIKGRFYNEKGKPAAMPITAYYNNFQGSLELESDINGYFELPEIEFYGPMEFNFMALDKKGNSIGKFEKMEGLSAPFFIPNSIKKPQIEKGKESLFTREIFSQDIKLPEVVINDKLPDSSPKAIYGIPNYVVAANQLMKGGDQGDLLLSLRGHVPGMSVTTTGAGQQQVRLRGGAMSAQLSMEPVVMVDGTIMPTGAGTTVADNLKSFNPNDIERVEIVTSTVPMMGDMGRNGVIAIYLKKGYGTNNLQELLLKSSGTGLKPLVYEGYALPSSFPLVTEEDIKNFKQRDERITLYWNPYVVTSSENGKFEFEFFDNGSDADKIVEIEGVTIAGQVIKAVFTLSKK
jgi:hypothetical protein